MTNFGDARHGYDDRYDGPDLRHGRPYDPRFERGQGLDPRGPRFEGPPRDGDSLREPRWVRAEQQRRAERAEARSGGTSMVKVIEVLAQSPHSWEDATRRAVAEASRTIRGIRSIYVKDMQAIVEGDQVVCFRINAKISFAIDDGRRRP